MASSELERLISDAYSDSGVKARLMYFPDQVLAGYQLTEQEHEAVVRREVSKLELPPELSSKAKEVFDLSGP